MSATLLFCSEADEARKFRQEEQNRQKSTAGFGDSGCLEANGWSLPPKFHTASDGSVRRSSVPIPVYCRPVTDQPSVQVTDLYSSSIRLS